MNTEAQIVVGYDGKPDSLAALTWAAEMASRRGGSIVATIIIDPRETPRGTAWPESYWKDVEGQARAVLAKWPDVPAKIERHGGHLVPRLIEAARNSSMLVVGSRGHTLVGEMFLGSVSQSAARHAAVPVVVVRPQENPESGRIVVGADGSDSGQRALEFACQMAGATGDKIVALRAWQPASATADRYGYVRPVDVDNLAVAEASLGRIVEDLRGAHPELPIEGELFNGPAERGLIDASGSASMVIVGSRGHSAVGEVLAGSVSRAVVHKAHCPVAVVH